MWGRTEGPMLTLSLTPVPQSGKIMFGKLPEYPDGAYRRRVTVFSLHWLQLLDPYCYYGKCFGFHRSFTYRVTTYLENLENVRENLTAVGEM